MNLDKAYMNWRLEPENTQLAVKTEKLFHKVWWLIPTNKPCSYYTFDVLGRALSQVQYDRKDKAQAASVMFHVLTWAHEQEPDVNPRPSFSFLDLLEYGKTKPAEEPAEAPAATPTAVPAAPPSAEDIDPLAGVDFPDAPEESVKTPKLKAATSPSAEETDPLEGVDFPDAPEKPAKTRKPKAAAKLATARRAKSKANLAVVQLDAQSFEKVRIFPSAHAAQKKLGICNIYRAVESHRMAGGFYWCRKGEENDFKPDITRRTKVASVLAGIADTASVTTVSTKLLAEGIEKTRDEFQQMADSYVQQVLEKCSDEELIGEMRRRSWKGSIEIIRKVEL